ncbi:PAS domain-containing sensor histidine kinase [Bacillus sp. FJAT-27245]|uniref:PAS domain-containing sensor histidine kinase n=1 Tax=Bacillus sp. FJAT-27245 TaxID=1684144 RepID=UPI0006A7A7C5|nr:PAS domain S-box protein [Bacillus sp. FJAT-27245]
MSKSYPIFGYKAGMMDIDSEKLADLFFTCTPDGFVILDMDNRFIRVNPMYTAIFGYEERELLGKNFDEFGYPERDGEILEQVKQGLTFTNLKTEGYHKNGNLLDIAASFSPFKDSNGNVAAVIGIFRDITESKKLERELKKSRELYRLITENTTDLISIFTNTRHKTFLFASPSHEKWFGKTPEQIVGRSLYDFITEEEAASFKILLEEYERTGEPIFFEKEMRTIKGDTIYLEYNVSPIYNESNEIETFLAIARNITDRVRNEAALRNLDRLSIIGQLAAGVAHEIRNPLTSLKGFSKLLHGGTSAEKQEQYLEIIQNELERIDIIVNEFMSLAKPQAIEFKRAQLYSIIESTINILQPQALLHNVQIKTNYPAKNIELMCSPNQLKQVFVNFLKNAIEAMPDGGNVYIIVQLIKNSRVLIQFKDEGIGIDPEIIGYLGTPFYTTKDKGIGLGLTVSNKILQEHGGEMKIDSQAGIGTTVSIELECL